MSADILGLRTKPVKAMAPRELVQVTGIDQRLLILRALKSIGSSTTRSGTLSLGPQDSCAPDVTVAIITERSRLQTARCER